MKKAKEKHLVFLNKYDVPEIAYTYSGAVLILGGGHTMWDDLDRAREICSPDIIAVNMQGLFVKSEIQHLFSFHWRELPLVKQLRKLRFPDDKSLVHGQKDKPGIDYAWPTCAVASFSGIGAICLAMLLGYEKIILCGIPMDGGSYYYQPYENKQTWDDGRIKEIHRIKEWAGDCVRSMSGNTADILGKPDEDWLRR